MIAIYHRDDYNPYLEEDEEMHRAIDTLNEEMVAAGVRVFVGGLQDADDAKSLRSQPDGNIAIENGPYLKTTEHMAGFWVLDAADMDEALEWGRKAVIACCAPVEVRRFAQLPEPHDG